MVLRTCPRLPAQTPSRPAECPGSVPPCLSSECLTSVRPARGIDLKLFFEAPQPFDLVMLLTGAGAVPYLREEPIAAPQRWGEITQAFEDNFFAYAFWFN
jgi:hypothetical protein